MAQTTDQPAKAKTQPAPSETSQAKADISNNHLNLLVSDRRTGSNLLVGETHLVREGGVRGPLGRSARGGLLHHLVDLLQGQALGLWDEEVGVDKGAEAEGAPDEEDLGAQVALVRVDHVGGDDGDDAVPEPVGGGGQGDTAGTDRQREDLCDRLVSWLCRDVLGFDES